MNLNFILQQFFKEKATSIVPYGEGHINTTYKVTLDNGKSYILQCLNGNIFKTPQEIAHNFEQVSDFLEGKRAKFPVLRYHKTLGGSYYYVDGQRAEHWRVLPYIPNSYSVNKVNAAQAKVAAYAFGEFFSALHDIDTATLHSTIPNFHNGLFRLSEFQTALSKASVSRLKMAKRAIAMIETHQEIFHYIAALTLPLRITHNDTKINNLLFDKETHQPKAIIDWDTLMPGTILSDFGDMVRTYTCNWDESEPKFNLIALRKDSFKSVCEGFLAACDDCLQPIERNNLLQGTQHIILMQCMRFLTDYLNKDVYYKTNYPKQNLHRALNQLALYESLWTQRDVLQEIIGTSITDRS
jgi:aminoglycoside phosphotransferase (APT) family kinase protein